ncbi:MAG: Carbohydrate acetyl esterase/feruloyl esterase [Pedosphaera sp.]|nr:Carbohydrate acetyl esterase/feruloyl esterase [Pedosphaera sp.]
MKFIALLPLVLLSTAIAGLAADAPPARRPQTRSPEVSTDRHVTFGLQAPKAAEVSVSGQWAGGRTAMTRDTNGIWTATVGPIEPGVYEYSFQVDGLSMIDPGNPAIKPMREPRTSILHLPGRPPLLYDFQDVPHGVVHQHTYFSKSLGRPRELVVYTPPGYDQHPRTRYPTLYLQHGSGDNQATWVAHGKAHWILDNLIAQGRAKPMVLVMADGHAVAPGDTSPGAPKNLAAFETDLLENVMPFVEKNYRVKTDAANRAIVGLSMGGEQSLRIGLTHPALFAWVGGFSSAAPSAEAFGTTFDAPGAVNQKLKLLWVGCGRDDFLLKRNEEFIDLLKAKGIHYEWNLSAGTHSWPVWRLYLTEFAPKLFQ